MPRIALIAALTALCLVTPATAAHAPNVVGTLSGSPYAEMAPCVPDEPCDQPARILRLTFSRHGHVAGRALVGARGRFRLYLRPGRYHVRVVPRPTQGRLTPSVIRVPRHGVTHPHLAIR